MSENRQSSGWAGWAPRWPAARSTSASAWREPAGPAFRRSCARQGFLRAEDSAGLLKALDRPRLVLLALPAGPLIDRIIGDLRPRLDPGDVILDGGNSYWGDGSAGGLILPKEWRSTASTLSDRLRERAARTGTRHAPKCFNDSAVISVKLRSVRRIDASLLQRPRGRVMAG